VTSEVGMQHVVTSLRNLGRSYPAVILPSPASVADPAHLGAFGFSIPVDAPGLAASASPIPAGGLVPKASAAVSVRWQPSSSDRRHRAVPRAPGSPARGRRSV